MKLTIAAINLQSGVATTKGGWHYALTAWKYWLPHSDWPIIKAGKMLKEEKVDIACVTEISDKSLCTGFGSQIEILAKSAEMAYQHFFSTKVPFAVLRDEGNAIFSRHPVASFASYPLHKELFNTSLDEAAVEVEGKRINIFTAHLALTKKHRDIQVKEIVEILKKKDGPMILAGDFNERNPEALDILLKETPLKHKCTVPTFPSWNRKHSIDYILLSKEFTVLECNIPKSPPFSDHVALVVKAQID